MDKRALNVILNGLKDAFPERQAFIEAMQSSINKKIPPMTESERRSLLAFPMQFIRRIDLGNGEWTTRLHQLAQQSAPELLMIDPLTLTAKNSDGDTVLITLIDAALGKYTEMIDYDLIRDILNTNMEYAAISDGSDTESLESGNAWDDPDLTGNTPIQNLYDFATGTGVYQGMPPDETLTSILTDWPLKIPDTEKTPDPRKSEAIRRLLTERIAVSGNAAASGGQQSGSSPDQGNGQNTAAQPSLNRQSQSEAQSPQTNG